MKSPPRSTIFTTRKFSIFYSPYKSFNQIISRISTTSQTRMKSSLWRCSPSSRSANMLKQRFRAHFGRYSSSSYLPSSTSQKVITSVTQDNTKSTDLIAQARQVIEKEPLHFSRELEIIGNKGGFDIFREFRAMNKKIDALWEDLRFQQAELKTQQAELKTLQVEMNNFQGSLKSTQAKLKSLN